MIRGIQQGMIKGLVNTAKKLKKMGFDAQIISESTGLSLDEIKKI